MNPDHSSNPDLSLTVAVGCYGAYPQYSIRAVESLLANCDDRKNFNIFVGCNESSHQILNVFRNYYDQGRIEALVECRRNINKDPMMRVLLELCSTRYLLWLDDDSHVLPGWDTELLKFMKANLPLDVAGHTFFVHRRFGEHETFLRQRPWYVSKELEEERIWFATGGLFLARVGFLRKHNFPDRALVKRADDVFLGELCQQQKAILRDFGRCRPLMDRIKISDGNRRGSGEGADGWLQVDPITGT